MLSSVKKVLGQIGGHKLRSVKQDGQQLNINLKQSVEKRERQAHPMPGQIFWTYRCE